MAGNYASLITQRQPHGALRLAGFSAGGLFALATAAELEQRGRTVSLVGMIDTPVAVLDPDYPRELVLKNLIAECYDHLTSTLSSSLPHESACLSDSIMELAKRTAAAKEEAVRVHLVMDWMFKHGVTMDKRPDSASCRFVTVFIRHAALISAVKLETLAAPVWLWRGSASWLTSLPLVPDIYGRITRGNISEELLDGRHFELMQSPLVKTLAARLACVLAETEELRPAESTVMI